MFGRFQKNPGPDH
jgi:hypothetical protein